MKITWNYLSVVEAKNSWKQVRGKLGDVAQIQIHVYRGLPANGILNLSGSILSVAERESLVR